MPIAFDQASLLQLRRRPMPPAVTTIDAVGHMVGQDDPVVHALAVRRRPDESEGQDRGVADSQLI